jgi:hypothetical protein
MGNNGFGILFHRVKMNLNCKSTQLLVKGFRVTVAFIRPLNWLSWLDIVEHFSPEAFVQTRTIIDTANF